MVSAMAQGHAGATVGGGGGWGWWRVWLGWCGWGGGGGAAAGDGADVDVDDDGDGDMVMIERCRSGTVWMLTNLPVTSGGNKDCSLLPKM